MRSLKILGGRVDAVTLREVLDFAERKISNNEFAQILTVNPLMLDAARKDFELKHIFEECGLAVGESSGISLVARLKGFSLPERIPGIDLFVRLCEKASGAGWPVFLFGGGEGVAARASAALTKMFPNLNICGTSHGFPSAQEEEKMLTAIDFLRPKLVFVALGVPAQEKWIHSRRSRLSGAVAMGVGGSFDVLSGKLRRAPVWMQKAGLEWLFRMIQEPRRIVRGVQIPFILILALFRRI